MKKRILSMLLAVVMLLGMFPGVASAADSVEEALGEVDIYNGGQKLSYLSINGRVRTLIYTYYNYVDRNGNTKEIPAYCVNPNTLGVPQTVAEGESIKYMAEEIGSDPKVMGIIANGYPHRGLSELKLENKYHAYYATKMALWCYLLSHWDINNLKVNPNLTGVELERANKILAAAKDIYRRGTAWSTVLSPNVTAIPDQEVAYPATVNGQEYLQQIFTVTSETWVCDYSINVAFTDPSAVPAGTKIVDMNNREIDVITTQATGQGYSGQFKVLYPVSSVEGQSGSVQLSFRTNVYKYAIYYAVCAETDKYGNLQNYMCDTDPTTPLALTAYSSYTDNPEEDPTETSLKIIKYEEGTTIPLKGATFEVVDPEGATVGTFSTNSKGQIVIPLTLAGNYTVYEREAPNGYLLSEEPAQNVKVEYGRQATVTFENAPYGNLLVRKFSDSGMQLPGAVVRIEHIESGAAYTGETNYAGVAVFNEIEPGAYRITEIAAPAGYIMSDEVYNTTVLSGDTVEVSIVNEEKPGLRIIKYDSKTHEALPNISFEVFRDTQSLGIFKTDEFGEILLTDLDTGTYLVKEVATDSSHIINSNPQQIELEGSDGILELFFFNDQKPGIHLVKLDSTTLEPLPNARFRIEHVGGTFSKEYVTDENGEVDISDLEPGAYRVTELEAPDGYLIDDAQRVIQINGNENAQFVFTNTRKPSITVVKYDPVADKYLPGAIFRVAKIEDGSHYLDRVTETNGSFTITDLEPGVYSVQEQAAPSGYVLNSHEYHVELFPGQNSQVVVVNEAKPDLRIIKTDADTGKPVSGVTFTVRYADGSTITTEATDENGEVFLEDMEPGAYEVWEQSVPENYILDTEHQHITLEPIREGDTISAFNGEDSVSYSDLFTWFDSDSYSASTGTEKTFTVHGINVMGSGPSGDLLAAPNGATVKVYKGGKALSELATTVDENGRFAVTFPEAGTYTIKVSGTAYYGSYSYSGAPVVPSQCTVYVSGTGTGTGTGTGAGTETGTGTTVSVSGDDHTIHVDATVEGAKATIDEVDPSDLNKVVGNHVNTGTVTIDFSGLESEEAITTVEIPAAAIKQIAEAVNDPKNDAHSLEIVLSDGASIEFDAAALKEKASQAKGADITVSIVSSDEAKLSSKQTQAVGKRPAYDINVTSGGKYISDMGGKITVHAPYVLKGDEKARGIVVYYVDDNGNKERCETSYDPIKKRVNWKTDHLSLYMIGYDETLVNNPFIDVTETAYYFDAVLWAVDEGITNGTSATTFSPDASCTRAQMVTFLWRAAGSPKATATTCVFTDVDKDAYYYEALLWAIETKLTNGTSATTFSPDAICTRGQMATFLYRNAKTPVVTGTHAFTDVKVDAYYNDAVIWAAAEGITVGTSATTFSPDADCTRGQMVTFLYRYLGEEK